MGDPECQTILPRLENDFFDVIKSCIDKKLDSLNLNWSENQSLCIVLCSKGYPGNYQKNLILENIKSIKTDENNLCFHAGTILKNNKILSVGGRVLNFVSIADNYSNARQNVIKNIDTLDWKDGFYRKDIGYKVIDE